MSIFRFLHHRYWLKYSVWRPLPLFFLLSFLFLIRWFKSCCNQYQSYSVFQWCLCRVWSALTGQLRVDSAQGQEASASAVTGQRPQWMTQAWPKTVHVYFHKRNRKLGQTIVGRSNLLQMVLHQQNACNIGQFSSLAQIWLCAESDNHLPFSDKPK